MPSRPVIAVLDDEPDLRTALCRLLRLHGFQPEPCASAREFFARTTPTDCLLLDLHMPESNGFEVLERLSGDPSAPPVIVITGHDLPGNARRVAKLGASAYLVKPVDETPLLEAITSALAAGRHPGP